MSTFEQITKPFLNVQELAELLNINEKKVYQLAGDGALPGTKVTGKWIFPRTLIDTWLIENSHGGVMNDRLLLAGSDDRLVRNICSEAAIEWQRDALISYSPNGTRHGLKMLDQGRVDACFINWGEAEPSARRHLGLLRGYQHHNQWVIVRCLQRSQGFILRHDFSDSFKTQCWNNPTSLIQASSLRWAMRHDDSGAERLLEDLCAVHQVSLSTFTAGGTYSSERAAVAAVNTSLADICCGVQSTARDFGLHYVPIATVALDLVMPQRTYFRTLVQELIVRIRSLGTDDRLTEQDGYQINLSPQVIPLNA